MASLASLQKRYERSLKNKDYYGAEQACRMMHHRLTQNKSATQEDVTRAFGVLQTGAVTLLEKQQVQAGTALGLLAVKHAEDHRVRVSPASVASFKKIAESYGAAPEGDNNPIREFKREKLRFAKAVVAWSARQDCGGFKNGHAGLNAIAARAASDAEDFELAQRLFINSDDPDTFAGFLHEYAECKTLSSEKALVLTRALLKYLVAENVKDAVIVRSEFARLAGWKSVESRESPEITSTHAPPLGNFCELLVKLCQLEPAAAPLYTKVLSVYEPELKRDESIAPMLTTIGSKYFGIQPPQPAGLGGMMGSMLRGLMNQ